MTSQNKGPNRPPESPAAVEGMGIDKSFGGVLALCNASFSAKAGEVHALVGENGAGKSTLIKVLGGRLRPDNGRVRLAGKTMEFARLDAANALGAWTVFQELTLFPWMTVAENLLLGQEPRGPFGLIQTKRMVERAEEILGDLGIEHIDPRALIEDISLAERQIVEIVRVIIKKPAILFLDEPTSSLVEREVEWLFQQIAKLRSGGACIIFTSHRWNEVRSIADRITVFRNGTEVGTYTDLSEEEAVTLMTGRRIDALYPALPPYPEGTAALEVRELNGTGVHDVSLTLHKGEILGIGGLAGHGHRQLFFMLFGAEKAAGGMILVGGKAASIRGPRDAIACGLGIALVPEDRKTEGLLLEMSVRDNLTLSVLARVSRGGVILGNAESRVARRIVDALQIRTQGLNSRVGALSGGNQQKVLLGRWLLADCHVMLLYDVTRGVDVATKHEIYELMTELVRQGRSILFYSSDAEELARLSHRVLVMREGRIASELTAGNITAEKIVAAAVRDSVAA